MTEHSPYDVDPTAENLMRLIADLDGRGGVDDVLHDCWEFMPSGWQDLWNTACILGRELPPIPEI